jgi:succinate dehydrogenase/fumarate reductase flavoprotein subunit
MQVHNTDVVIVGGGAAGCYAGLNLHRGGAKTIIVCKMRETLRPLRIRKLSG